MKLIVGLLFEYDGDGTKVATKMFIHSIHETTIQETDCNVFSEAIIKSFIIIKSILLIIINKCNDIR